MQSNTSAAEPLTRRKHRMGEGIPKGEACTKKDPQTTHRLRAAVQHDILRRHAEHARHKAVYARNRLFAEYGEGGEKKASRRGRPAVGGKQLPTTVEALIRAYCADYDRRARIVADAEREAMQPREPKDAPPTKKGKDVRIAVKRTSRYPAPLISHLRETNELIDEAIAATCDKAVADTMRHDLGERLGHRRTALYFVSTNAYLRQKRRAKLAIAAALELM